MDLYYGADYYPEHWPENRWEVDAELMENCKINIVRVGEFAWAKLEPAEGEYNFDWLDKAIDILSKHDINVVIGTPTAAPPKWLVDKHPEILMRDEKGHPRGFGTRRHYCYNSPVYQKYTKEIVKKMAEHFKGQSSIVAWQIDNEFGCHDTTRCYCENCLQKFRKWLKEKYGDIDELNKAWGTIFWSQIYRSFEEIILPAYTVCDSQDHSNPHNPGLMLDFYRFSSDSVVKYQKLQIDEIKKYSLVPITHNLMGHFDQIDYFDLSKDLDFVSWDNYPNNQWNKASYQLTAMAHDLMRGIKNKNFWVMEEQSGPCGWSVMGDTPKPGQIRLWAYQAIAHGAEAILYFRWRACTFGTEEYWYGILDHDGIPRRRYYEVQQVGRELSKLSDLILDSRVVAQIAIVKSYDNLWSHELQPHNSNFDYNGLIAQYYKGLIANNVSVDMISEECSFDKYKVVFMPAFNLMTDEIQSKVEEYVKNGGVLVITFRSGTRNWDNSITTKTLPGYFKKISGIEVEEFDSLNQGRKVIINGIDSECSASIWCDILKTSEAETLATYGSDYYKGKSAITVNNFGKGRVYYIGCDLDNEFMKKLLYIIISDAGIRTNIPKSVKGVETVLKKKDTERYLMILNHNSYPVNINVGGKYKELITGDIIDGSVYLLPFGVAILRD